jgi:hypothetical protein
MRNIKDITTFFQRLPSKVEQDLIENPILPSDFISHAVSAYTDKEVYLKEVSGKMKHYKLTYIFKDNEHEKFREKSSNDGELLSKIYLDYKSKLFSLRLKQLITKNKLKLGFYTLLRLDCYFSDFAGKGDGVQAYITSLSHRRNEVFINKVSDINPVLRILINEAMIRILEFDNGPSVV